LDKEAKDLGYDGIDGHINKDIRGRLEVESAFHINTIGLSHDARRVVHGRDGDVDSFLDETSQKVWDYDQHACINIQGGEAAELRYAVMHLVLKMYAEGTSCTGLRIAIVDRSGHHRRNVEGGGREEVTEIDGKKWRGAYIGSYKNRKMSAVEVNMAMGVLGIIAKLRMFLEEYGYRKGVEIPSVGKSSIFFVPRREAYVSAQCDLAWGQVGGRVATIIMDKDLYRYGVDGERVVSSRWVKKLMGACAYHLLVTDLHPYESTTHEQKNRHVNKMKATKRSDRFLQRQKNEFPDADPNKDWHDVWVFSHRIRPVLCGTNKSSSIMDINLPANGEAIRAIDSRLFDNPRVGVNLKRADVCVRFALNKSVIVVSRDVDIMLSMLEGVVSGNIDTYTVNECTKHMLKLARKVTSVYDHAAMKNRLVFAYDTKCEKAPILNLHRPWVNLGGDQSTEALVLGTDEVTPGYMPEAGRGLKCQKVSYDTILALCSLCQYATQEAESRGVDPRDFRLPPMMRVTAFNDDFKRCIVDKYEPLLCIPWAVSEYDVICLDVVMKPEQISDTLPVLHRDGEWMDTNQTLWSYLREMLLVDHPGADSGGRLDENTECLEENT